MTTQAQVDIACELAKIDSPTIANAIEKLKGRNRITGFANRELRCLFPELPPVCGYAVTAQVRTMTAEDTGKLGKEFVELCEVIASRDAPSIVVLQEVGPLPQFSAHCGEVMATAFAQYGAVGLVSDSAVRDLHEVRALNFQYFAPGAVVSHGAFRIERVQVPVTVCGLSISPGDLLHGDANGLLSVPPQGREKLTDLSREIFEAEHKVMDLFKQGKSAISDLRDHLCH